MTYMWIIPLFIAFAALQLYEAYKKMKANKSKNDMNFSMSIMVNILTAVLIMPLIIFLKKVSKGSVPIKATDNNKMMIMVVMFLLLCFLGNHLNSKNK